MADSNSPAVLSVSPPNQISKDVPVPDNAIPLSPQWLLSKTGESNAGMSPGGNHSSPYLGSKNYGDSGKLQGSGEKVYDPHKKEVYRPTWRDEERDTNVAIRRDHWREGEEERDTNVAIRRDRWKESDEELGDTRKMERWANNASAKNFGEGRRLPSERWNDPTKEAASDQRRENKWSTRWGPDDKDKSSDLGKHGDASLERGLSNSNHAKDEREGDHVKPWRPTSMSRGRTDPLHNQSHITSKEGHGHGRGEITSQIYPRVRGRIDFDINSNAKIPTLGKADDGRGEPSPYRYDRTKLLDLYSVTDLRLPKLLGNFAQVPSLTQEEPVEPSALSALTSEELAIFRGIDEGDITTGAPPLKTKDGAPMPKYKDGSVGQGSSDFEVSRDGPPGTVDDVPRKREPDTQGSAPAHSSTTWKASKISWSEAQKERSGLAKSSFPQNEPKWQTGEDRTVRRQQLVPGDRELEARKPLQPSPEDLVLYYKDPQGLVQGPFSGIDIIGWFEAGYFGIDLLVRLANAPPDSPYMALGDMMPHLRAKARPPPGFSASKPNEIPYISTTRPVLTGQSGIEMILNEHNHAHGSMNGGETRFLESLMSGTVSSSSLGAQGYAGHNSSAMPPLGMESGDSLNLLAKRLAIEQQRSLSNSYPNWQVKDAPSIIPHSEIPHESSFSQNPNLPPQAFGMLQQRVQPQNQPSVAHLLSQTVDNPSTIATPENVLSSSLAQGPQILNLLQQQHMLLMQPQTPLTLQQLSMLEKILVLKQQEEQLRVQQQQLHFSQVLAEHHQRLGEPTYGQLHPTAAPVSVGASVPVTAGSMHVDHLRLMIPQQILQVGPQVPASSLAEDRSTMFAVSSSMNLPHHSSIAAAFAESVSKPEAAQSFQVDSAPVTETSEIVSGNETPVTSNVTTIIKEDVTPIEAHEVKKTSEKKSRKQKSSKAQTSSEQVKGVAKSFLQQPQQTLAGVTPDTMSDVPVIAGLMDNSWEAVETEKIEDTSEVREVKPSEYVEKQNTLENSAHRGWKPTVNVKPKSFLEIQQEEEMKVKTEFAISAISSSVSSLSLAGPWAGIISNSEQKNSQGVGYSDINVSKTESSVAKKSQLHDLLAAEVLAQPIEKEKVVGAGSGLLSLPTPSSQADAVDDDFIEAKDTKKSRKKAGKAKAAGSKSSTSVPSVDAIISSSPIEKVKSSKKVQQEDRLPAPPMGPSLGDFVSWKGGDATGPSPAPAWSSGKLPKPASLREILVEEQRRGVPTQKQQLTIPQKSQAMPSKASVPVQISSQASAQPKYKGEDDLFWGPLEQSKQEVKRSDFPQLGNSGNKATSGVPLTGQKSAGRKGLEILSPPASSQSSLQGKRCGDNKRSEAMEFRDMNSNNTAMGDSDINPSGLDGSAKGGKKKGKKGKKVSPAVLGFNVVSNRIMMGEIQTVDD